MLSDTLYSQMLSNDPVSISDALLVLFDMDRSYQNDVIQWIRRFKKENNDKNNYHLILDVLKMFMSKKMVIMNKRLFFLLSLMMVMRTIHESIDYLKDHGQSLEYCYLILDRMNILQQFRQDILFPQIVLRNQST
jgi:hypothetical protein